MFLFIQFFCFFITRAVWIKSLVGSISEIIYQFRCEWIFCKSMLSFLLVMTLVDRVFLIRYFCLFSANLKFDIFSDKLTKKLNGLFKLFFFPDMPHSGLKGESISLRTSTHFQWESFINCCQNNITWHQITNIYDQIMFQNSIFNKIQIYCLNHPKNKISYLCTDIQCTANPLLCVACVSEFEIKNRHYTHEQFIKHLHDGIIDIANHIGKDKLTMEKIFKSSIGKKENQLLVTSLQQKERHYESIEKHIKTIQYQIEEEIVNISKLMYKSLEETKIKIFNELDSFYKTYTDNFEIFYKLIDPLVVYNRTYKYYCNTNNIALRLMTETKKNACDWAIDLKNIVNFTQKIRSNTINFEENLEKALYSMNSMLNTLPMIDFDEKKIYTSLSQSLLQIFRTGLRLNQLTNLNYIITVENSIIDKETRKKRGIFGSEQKLVLGKRNSLN